ncbi:hypothetical protein CTI12_AA285830 [Artemisia annua]|uniref:Uncharacterized protein n=1 Tax=Artemisia annua TaxID=35608 RepID=A0A2U1N2R3_ARTAN|nr:hypothetical protein CTI12_AA285830 [Artemisia annua]
MLGNMLSLLLPAGCTDKDLNFLVFEDKVKCIVQVCKKASVYDGKIIVEAVEIETNGGGSYQRAQSRALTVMHLTLPLDALKERQDTMVQDFVVEKSVVIQPDVQAMIACLSLSSEHLQVKYNLKINQKALCLGVGSGSLPSYLSKKPHP